MFLLSVLWGGTFFFAAVALRDLPPLTLVLARVAIAALALVVFIHVRGFRLPARLVAWRPFVALAMLNNIIPFSLIFMAQTQISSALASVLNATTPLFALIIARVLAAEALPRATVLGIGIGIVGVAILMLGAAAADARPSSLLGMACVLGAALSYGFSAHAMRRLRHIPPPVAAAAQVCCSSIMLLPVAAWVDRFWDLPAPSTPTVLAVLALSLLGTALAYIVFFRISATAGPSNVMLVTLLIPVTATALGTYVLGEALNPGQALGALVVGSGLIIIDGRAVARLRRWARRPAP